MDDRDLNFWLNFFREEKGDLFLFKQYLEEKDLFFLNNPIDLDYEDENYDLAYPSGFLEKDFQNILKSENEDNYYHTRLSLAINKGLNLDKIKNRIGEKNFIEILESALILGEYENLNVDFFVLLKKAINNKLIPKQNFADIAFLRGVELGKREE